MNRSFSQRILGGVCGGFAELTRLPASVFRALLIALTVITAGFATVVYLALWWILPLSVPSRYQRGSALRLLLAVLVIGIMAVLWWGREMPWLITASGTSLFLPAVLLMLSISLLLRQSTT